MRTKTRRQDNNSWRKTRNKNLLLIVAVGILLVASAGAAAGTILSGKLAGIMPLSVSRSLGIDQRTLGQDDVTYGDGSDVPRAVAVASDDGSGMQVASEVAVGDKFIIAVPLRNNSHEPITGIITLESVPAGLDLEVAAHSRLPVSVVTDEDAAVRGAPLTVGTHRYYTNYSSLADNNGDGKVDASDVTVAVTGIGSSISVESVNALMGGITYRISGAQAASLLVTYRYGSEINVVAKVARNQWEFTAPATLGENMSGDMEVIIAHADGSRPGHYTVRGTVRQFTMATKQ